MELTATKSDCVVKLNIHEYCSHNHITSTYMLCHRRSRCSTFVVIGRGGCRAGKGVFTQLKLHVDYLSWNTTRSSSCHMRNVCQLYAIHNIDNWKGIAMGFTLFLSSFSEQMIYLSRI